MKPIKSSGAILSHTEMIARLYQCDPIVGEVCKDESGSYWYYAEDGSFHKISNGSPFGDEIPGQLIIIDDKLYVITNDGELILCDIPNEDKTGGA